MAPWMARNSDTFKQYVFLRSNFWLEVDVSNGINSQGFWQADSHPNASQTEWSKYSSMGETAHIASRRQHAVAFIQDHPRTFAYWTLKRFVYFWAGMPGSAKSLGAFAFLKNIPYLVSSILAFWGLAVSIGKKQNAALLFGGVLLLFPLCITSPTLRVTAIH